MALIAGGVVAAILIASIVFVAPFAHAMLNTPFNDRPFDRSTWLRAANDDGLRNPRGPMADDLRRRYLRPEMTKSAVRELLGKPSNSEEDERRGNVDRYNIGAWGVFPIDPYYIVIHYDPAGRIISTRIEGT